MNNRNGAIDIYKFVAAIIIMAYHIFILIDVNSYRTVPFTNGWIFVEFFFFIDGYFTAKHFDKIANKKLEEISKTSLKYTLSKFLSFKWIILFSVGLNYLLSNIEVLIAKGIIPYLKELSNVVFEMLLLTSSFRDEQFQERLGPIWFLSALFICFPILCIIIQAFDRYTKIILGILISVLTYGWWGVKDNLRIYPFQLIRCMAGLLVGVVIFEIAQELKKKELSRLFKAVSVFGGMILTVVLTYYNVNLLNRYLLLLFIIIISIFDSINFPANRITNTLGQMSIYIFLLQRVTAITLNQTRIGMMSDSMKIAFWFTSTIAISLAIICLKNQVAKKHTRF